jgi:PmbA protein
MQTTANAGGIHNLVVEPDDVTFDALLKEMETGLVITELMGMGINTVTGDYSRGACGFWVEAGEIRFPVEEITVAGNLRDMYAGIRRIANDVDLRGNIRTGSMLIEEMTIAGD